MFRTALFAVAAFAMVLRGLCNVIDGLMAVEGGHQTPAGLIFNDMPDRFSDAIMLICAGYAVAASEWHNSAWGVELGWLAALLATLTAYVRNLGAASGAEHDYGGPMAKTHRMAVFVIACLVSGCETLWGWGGQSLAIALVAIIIGCAATIVRRTARIIVRLERGP